MQTFNFNHSKKEVLHFSFDVFFNQFRETHRDKTCDKNVNQFLLVRRKMAYPGVHKTCICFRITITFLIPMVDKLNKN